MATKSTCETCLGSGQLTADEDKMPLLVVQDKEKERPAWEGLVKRLKWRPCPDCGGPARGFSRKKTKK